MLSSLFTSMNSAPLSSIEFRQALGHFATGVTVITAERLVNLPAGVNGAAHASAHGPVHGMTANSFTSVSLEPLLILVCVAECAQMHGVLHQRRRFGVNILNSSQRAVSEFFTQPDQPADAERALGVRFRWTPEGIPLLEDTLVQLACNVVSTYAAGDHTVFLGEVLSVDIHPGEPLVYYRREYSRLR
jgi:flavin reductase (DIM6/NTAB) family NADH-FMN oxidoreductase RutF